MDSADIVAAAFRAWGRDMYRNMSLSDVAAELGVTKPALYRHFSGKDALLEAMERSFFDRYAEAARSAVGGTGFADPGEAAPILSYVELVTGYFGRRRDDLAFLFGRMMPASAPDARFAAELRSRGIPVAEIDSAHPERWVRLTSALTSAFLFVAVFHLRRGREAPPPSDEDIAGLAEAARAVCARGLGFSADAAARTDYAALDAAAALSDDEIPASGGLLSAVVAVVAEVGVWKATMGMVAKRAGLSKSGLYAHFDSREEMLARLFETELDRLAAAMERRVERATDAPSKLYLAYAVAASYLLERPEVLTALDWVRVQRLELRRVMPARMLAVFGFLSGEAEAGRAVLLPGGLDATIRWLLFLAVHQIMPCRGNAPADAGPRLRALHSFFLNGVGGA